MKVDLGIWSKLTWLVIGCALIAGIALVAGWYLPLINQNQQMRKRIFDLNNQIAQESATGNRLRAAIDSVQHDPKTVERLTREKLGYAKPGETIIHFEAPAAPGQVNSNH